MTNKTIIKKRFLSATILGAAAILCLSAYGEAGQVQAQYQDTQISGSVQHAISASLNAGKVYRKSLSDRSALQVFYQQRAFDPYWVDGDEMSRKAGKFLQVISDSWTHGLNPHDYHYSELHELVENPTPANMRALDVLMSDAFVRYAHDMTGMRINGKLFKLDAKDWKVNYTANEALALMNAEDDVDDLLELVEPQGQTYKALRRELVRLIQEESKADESRVMVNFGGLMKPGWSHKGVLNLRKRLGVDIPERNKYVYDDRLAAAVIKFQRENNLNPDGVVGENTLRVLNRTNKDKIEQLVANLERLRWAKPNTGRRFVIVNIPSYTLWAVSDGNVEIEMPVVVGSPARRTRSFATEIKGMRFNPTWTVPPTIKRADILPKVQEDPNYLVNKGIELFQGYGRDAKSLDPLAIDWHNISSSELHSIRMVQIPGDHNALGRYRVLMPNPYNMYLHDTNHPEVFDRAERAASSGCMRLKYPEKMAEWVMKGTQNWSSSKMENVIDSMKKTDVYIDEPIPVQVTYYTTWLDERGRVVYGNDVYGYDDKLISELTKLDAYRIPVHHKDSSSQFVPRAQLISLNR